MRRWRREPDGDRAAFDILCDRYLPIVCRRLRVLLPVSAVEDVAQEVFVAVVRSIKSYREDAQFRTWVAAIIRHKVADYYRSEQRSPQTVELDPAIHSPSAGSEAWRDQTVALMALQELKAEYQEVILLRFAEGLPFKGVASRWESRWRRPSRATDGRFRPWPRRWGWNSPTRSWGHSVGGASHRRVTQ